MNKRALLITIVVLVFVFGLYSCVRSARLSSELERLSVGSGDNTTAQLERAKEIIAKVKKHMVIDTTTEPTVANIVDVETLRKRSDFYKNAEKGDFLIVTPTRAILYSEKKDTIIDVIPIQLTKEGEKK